MSRKKTHEEYVKELAEKNPNVEVIGIYCGNRIKIPHRCKKCGNVWDASPTNILRGSGCPVCAGNLKLTNQEYIQKLQEINQDIEPIETYINSDTKIKHRCKIDRYIWESSPSNLLQGRGCPVCANKRKSLFKPMTHEEYVKRVNNINPNLEVIGTYIGSKIKISHKCKIDGHVWDVIPGNILRGAGCPICAIKKFAKKKRLSDSEYKKRLKIISPHIKVIDKYNCANNKIMHYCETHNEYFMITPANALKGCGCSKCTFDKKRKARAWTQTQYIEELANVNPNIKVVGTYINAATPILHRCIIDNFEWKCSPSNLLQGHGCPECSSKSSRGELQICDYLKRHNIEYIQQFRFDDCKDKNTLPFDFYLPNYNMLIEYDGRQHYESVDIFGGEEQLKLQQKHDKIKDDFCKENGISLLRIPYYKYDNIEEELNNFIFI